jgi:polar amino acid transport system substrate-binding protein
MSNLMRGLAGIVMMSAVGIAPARADMPQRVSFCFNEWPPYSSAEAGEPVGLSVDILREAARRSGITPHFVALPWKRCLKEVETGAIDAVMDAATRPEFVHGTISFSVYTNTFWVREDDRSAQFDRSVLTGRRLGIVAGYVYGEALDRLFAESGVVIDTAIDDATLVRKLAFGRTDIIVADHVSTRFLAAAGDLDIRPLPPPHSFDRLYPSFNRDRQASMRRIDEALTAMCADRWIARAYRDHLGLEIAAIAGVDLCAAAAEQDGRS